MSVTLTINGTTLSSERGQTILQVARAHGIYIPTLCDFPGLPSHGSCRMCIVEVQGRLNTPTACTMPVEEGMVVQTDTDKIRDLRAELLRMLLADHPGGCLFCPEKQHCNDCMVTLRKSGVTTGCRSCPADRQCALQEMVERSGLQSVAYPVRYRALRVEKEDPFFDRDYNLCVLCGRCIRVCETLHFTNIPTYVKRGSETRVGTNFGLTHLEAGCSFCGGCVEVCPTGSLMEKTRKWDGSPDGEIVSTCPFCSLGCEVQLEHKGGAVIGSLPGTDTAGLCVKGRFGVTETVNHPSRMKQVVRVEGGMSLKANWEEGLRHAAQALADCPPDEFAMVVSASCSSEDLFVARKFAREVMHSAGLYLPAAARYGAGLGAVKRMLEHSQPLAVLDQADLIFCLGLDAKYAQSVVEVHLLHAKARGAKLLTLNAQEHVPGRFADQWLKPLAGQEQEMIAAIATGRGLDPAATEVLGLLRAAQSPVFVVGPDLLARMPEAVERLQAATGAVLVLLPAEGNLSGALRLGLGIPQSSQPARVVYLLGAPIPPELGADAFVLYQNTHAPDAKTGLHAGLLLPMAAFSEADGSFVAQSGQVKRLRAAVAPPGDALPGWEILCRIARAMGKSGFDFTSIEEIGAEMAALPSTAGESPVFSPPSWLAVPGEHAYLGADLADWVQGLRVLAPFTREEESHVPTA
jgi:predicted molibdopterin-dependent oxidoreductase YjgC